MKILSRIIVGLVVVIAVTGIIGIFLPRDVVVVRQRTIPFPISDVHQALQDPRFFNVWSPWMEMDTAMKISYFGTVGEGAGYTWESTEGSLGTGTWKIEKVEPLKTVQVSLSSESMGASMATFTVERKDNGTHVSWKLESDMGWLPWWRWMGLMMDSWVGADFERGLAKLEVSMKDRPQPRTENFRLENLPPTNVMSVRHTVDVQMLGATFARDYSDIVAAIQSQNGTMAGIPGAIYHTWSATTTDVEPYIPVSAALQSSGRVVAKLRPAIKAVVVDYYGPYEGSEKAHELMDGYLRQNGHTVVGPPWEEYVTDPTVEKDPMKVLTRIYYPVK